MLRSLIPELILYYCSWYFTAVTTPVVGNGVITSNPRIEIITLSSTRYSSYFLYHDHSYFGRVIFYPSQLLELAEVAARCFLLFNHRYCCKVIAFVLSITFSQLSAYRDSVTRFLTVSFFVSKHLPGLLGVS
jgi:hypothetical protein